MFSYKTRCSVKIGVIQIISFLSRPNLKNVLFLVAFFMFFSGTTPNLFSQCTPPLPNAACTPPTSWDVNVVANGNVDWQALTGVIADNINVKIRITGSGTVTVNNKNVLLKSSGAVLFIDGPTLVINNGCLVLTVPGSKYIQIGGTLQCAGHVEQVSNTVFCMTGVTIEIGQEKAGRKYALGSTTTSAAFLNDGGYRYLENNCLNITSSFLLYATGSGTGINGVDVIKDCFFEIGDRGSNHALTTNIGVADAEDIGDWDSKNTQSIYNSTIIIANGHFLKTNRTSTYCDTKVKINKNGNFHINSGTVLGSGLCLAIDNDFGNCGTWNFTGITWYSARKNGSNTPGAGSESALQTVLNNCFSDSCTPAPVDNGGDTGGNNEVVCTDENKVSFSSGSYIINMGITPQTDKNALKPYGLIYDLIKNHNVKVIWVINPTKAKDGVDFRYNGIDYKGGPFVIPAEYCTPAVNARITSWQTAGVVGVTTISALTLCSDFVHRELKNVPRWTLDKRNGKLAVEYFLNAGIPATAFGGLDGAGWKDPSELDCCDDLFVLPHAEPSWAVHQRLYTWNLECKGGIWDGCTSGSALENMVNPANRNQQTNFLTVKDPSFTGSSGIYANSNSLMLWSTHNDGSPPYTHRLPADPVAQYISTTDGAHTNGAEQIYIPRQSAGTVARWNPTTKIIVYDPSHNNVPSLNPDLRNAAAPMVYGRGFGDDNRGFVMHSAGHSYDKCQTSPAHVAAQRAFFNFSWLVANDKAESINVNSLPDIANSGIPARVDFSLPNGQDLSGFTIEWSSNCGGTFSPSANHPNPDFIPPNTSNPTPCVLTVSITDACGRTTTDSRRVEILCDYGVRPTVVHPSCAGSADGSIQLNVTGSSVYGSNDWTWTRATPPGSGSGSASSISNLPAGTYVVTVTSFTGCSGSFTALLEEPNVLNLTASGTNFSCFGGTGSVTLNVTGGVQGYSYLWSDGPTTAFRTGVPAGNYQVTVTDANGCTDVASASVTGPMSGININLTKTNITCSNLNNGAISVSVSGGNAPLTYAWSDGSTLQNRTLLSSGNYTLTVSDNNGCTSTASTEILRPSPLLVSIAGSHPTCPIVSDAPLNQDGSVSISVSGGTPSYTYAWSNGATTQNLSGLSGGTFSVTVTDTNGCQDIKSTTLIPVGSLPNPPSAIIK